MLLLLTSFNLYFIVGNSKFSLKRISLTAIREIHKKALLLNFHVQVDSLPGEPFTGKQLVILKLLYDRPYRQNELRQMLQITAPGLFYHLEILEKEHLVEKKTVAQIGNAKINEISINPVALQRIRGIIGSKVTHYSLITGFGKLETGYRVPDIAYTLLREAHYPVDRIICFTTPDAKPVRDQHEAEEHLQKVHKFYLFDYLDFRTLRSSYFQQIEGLLQAEMQDADVMIDLTPLSKLYSFKMLEIANKYHLPCFYLGGDGDTQNHLIWLTNVKIQNFCIK